MQFLNPLTKDDKWSLIPEFLRVKKIIIYIVKRIS